MLCKNLFAFDSIITCFYSTDFWMDLLLLLMSIGFELWIGGFVIGAAISITAYFTFYNIIKKHRIKHPHKN